MNHSIAVAGTATLISTALMSGALASSLTITTTNGATLAVLDRPTIESMGMRSVETATPWTGGPAHFQGVPVADVLARTGAGGRNVTALAFDDYAVTLTAQTIARYSPIIATRLNGELLTLDNKGPFWIIFDFDDVSEEAAIELRSLAVWHLIEFEVE